MPADDSTANPAALVGRSIAGKFVVEALVASGGAGTVYRARQLALDRTVALKVLHQDVARDAHFVERFKREARAASRLDHPHSVRVFDFGHVDESLLYLAMEYVEGRTLHDVIAEEWPLGDARVVDIMSQVLSAIAVAHEMGVIHRDLKPDNIMIIRTRGDDGEDAELAKVCDFGIATLGAVVQPDGAGTRAAGPWATNDGTLVGTPGYMSPEQARGGQADARSDIYSAGVILYQMLTGRPPFEGGSAYFVAMKHITEEPVPPSVHAAVSPELEAICLRALNKAPEDRFASAREMRAALRAALSPSAPAHARTGLVDLTPPPQLAPPPRAPDTQELLAGAGIGAAGRRRRLLGASVGLAVVGVVAGAFAARSMLGAGARAPAPPPAAAAATLVGPAAPAPVASAAPPPGGAAPAATRSSAPVSAPEKSSRPHRPARTRQVRERGLVRAAAFETRRAPEPAPAAAAPVAPPAAPVAAAPAPPPAPAVTVRPPPAPAPAATAPSLARPPAPRVDVEHATASITAVTATSAIPGSNVRAALSRAPLARCYRDALRAGALISGAATLHLRIDATGYVTGAKLQGAGVTPALQGCIEKAATTARVKDVDTGDGTADVTINFVAAP
ncbi:MAG TPA: protein kinase [Polyangia bacterium]